MRSAKTNSHNASLKFYKRIAMPLSICGRRVTLAFEPQTYDLERTNMHTDTLIITTLDETLRAVQRELAATRQERDRALREIELYRRMIQAHMAAMAEITATLAASERERLSVGS